MSNISNINHLSISGSTFNVVSGNQSSSTAVLSIAGPSKGVPAAQAVASTASSAPTPSITLPSGSKAPPRLTTLFTGRKDILEQLIRCFKRSQTSVVLKRQLIFVLYGLGGGGKTQIMMKFVEEFFDQFSDIYYIDASMLATIQSGFEDIARNAAAGRTAEDAVFWLSQQHKEWLLLLDNADDPNINLRQFIPSCRHGNVIITSRNKACRLHAPDSNCCVSEMTPDDSTELLLKCAMVERSDENRRLCRIIAHELGCLALAVAQAGAYIAQSSCLDDYLQIYRKDHAELLRRHSVQTTDDYKWTVYTTWEMSLKQLTPTAAKLLLICAFMHYEGISRRIFMDAAAAGRSDGPFQDASRFLQNFETEDSEWSNIRFLDFINELASYSLINVSTERQAYSIHPLVHAWSRDRASPEEYSEAQACARQILALAITDNDSAESYAFRRTLLPHVNQAREGNINIDIAKRFQLVYTEAGRYKEAEELQKLVVDACKEALGDKHPDTLCALVGLARTYSSLGRLKEAEELEVEVMKARRTLLGNDHPHTLTVISNLAVTFNSQGRLQEAEELQLEVMDARKRLLGDDHPDTLTIMANIARTYNHQGRSSEAEPLEVKVMEARKRLFGTDHPDTLSSMANLAITYSNQDRWTDSEALEAEVMEARKRLLGDDHPDTLTIMANLARTYSHQHRLEEAETLETKVMQARKTLLGDEHPDTLTVMANLAITYSNQNRWAEAEALEEKVMEARKKMLGDNHPDTLSIMANLARTYSHHDRWTDAEKLEAEVLEARKRVLGVNHPDTLTIMVHLAITYSRLNRWKEAEALETKVLETRKSTLGRDHPDTLAIMVNLAISYYDQDQLKEAEALELEVMEARRRLLGEDHPATLSVMANLARTYRRQNRWKEAEALEQKRRLARGEDLPESQSNGALPSVLPKQQEAANIRDLIRRPLSYFRRLRHKSYYCTFLLNICDNTFSSKIEKHFGDQLRTIKLPTFADLTISPSMQQPLDYNANRYLIVTLSDPSALQNVHPAITDVGQVGQLRDVHRLGIANHDWDNDKEHILESLKQAGVSRIDYDELRQRSRRDTDDL